MSIRPASDGGRVVCFDTAYGRGQFDVDRSASGKRLRLVDEHGVEHGSGEIDIRDVPVDQAAAIERAAGRRRCGGCGDR